MLEKIKSSYFVKNLFSNLEEGNKLKVVKYNKRLQNNLDINLFNYKEFTKKYIIYGKNGKGKEYYYDDKLSFEGEYLNGKRNGKGKEYDYNGNKSYEGEYLNGKRHGKGKEYNEYGFVKFKGEYLNGKKWNGKGKEHEEIIILI